MKKLTIAEKDQIAAKNVIDGEVLVALRAIEAAYKALKEKVSDWNEPGARVAVTDALIMNLKDPDFEAQVCWEQINDYYFGME